MARVCRVLSEALKLSPKWPHHLAFPLVRGTRSCAPRPWPASGGGSGLRPAVLMGGGVPYGLLRHEETHQQVGTVGTSVSGAQDMAVKLGKAGGLSEHLYNRKELCAESPVTKVRNGGGFWFLHLSQ